MPHLVEHSALDAALARYIAERDGTGSYWGPSTAGWYVLDDDGKVLAGPFQPKLTARAEIESEIDRSAASDSEELATDLDTEFIMFRRQK